MKRNCWEIKRCGREVGGANAELTGPCPAATVRSLDGVHGGRNGGRSCWIVAGTFCDGVPQGTFAQKIASCMVCPVYQQVRDEEEVEFLLSSDLLERTG